MREHADPRPAWPALLLGLLLVLLGAGAVIASTSDDDGPTLRVVGEDAAVNLSARVDENIDAHNSPTLVRNPERPENLAVSSRIDTPFFSCGLHVSFDAGAHWSQTPIPAPKGEEAKCFDPDVAFGADGTLYYSYVTLKGDNNDPNVLWVVTSRDGGRTLSAPVRVSGPLAFQVRLAADPARAGRVHLSWMQSSDVGTLGFDGPGRIMSARSDDGATTWSRPAPVSPPGRPRAVAPAPVVGRDGALYVLYVDLRGDRLDYEGVHRGRGGEPYAGRISLVLARSGDGGARWEESVVDDRLTPIERFLVFLADPPSVAVDADGRVYAAMHDDRLGDPDVWLWTRAPGASRWEAPRRVNDTRRGDATAQYLPALAMAPDGRLDVLYYDRRADRRNVLNEVSLQSSFDHGRTFTPSLLLSGANFDARIGFGAKEGLPDLGSRLALISDDHAALGVWTDTRGGTPATQKQNLFQAIVTVTPPDGLSDAMRWVLRLGGLAVALAGVVLVGFLLRRRTG
ncbi:MAG: sialidase family protein [Solirubrobacteraceae bacterium]|nr:sialidase family protein [Solirubrobacteraceae bacterium]